MSIAIAFLFFGTCVTDTAKAAEEQGRAALAKRDFTRAIESFEQAQAACPGENGIAMELANACLMAQRFQKAKTIAQSVLARDPANAAALEIKGNVEFLEGHAPEAISTFIGLLESHPENREASYMLGRIYYEQGSIDQAIGQFERLLRLDPDSHKAYDGLGLCYEAKGENERAIGAFLRSIQLAQKQHPVYDAAYADLAELLLKTGDAEKAFGAASKAADRNPYSARNFYLGGRALEQLGKTDLCINWLKRAAALDPNYPEPEYALARVYRRIGDLQKADEAQRKFLAAKAKKKRTGPM